MKTQTKTFMRRTLDLRVAAALLAALSLVQSPVRAQEAIPSEREAMYYRYLEFASLVKGGSVQPHWMADGNSFWYAEGAPANTIIYKVEPKANKKEPLFDTTRLRKALTPLLGYEPPYQGLPFETFTFVDGEKRVRFKVENKQFILDLDSYIITPASTGLSSEEEKNRLIPQRFRMYLGAEIPEVLSPDGRWFASVKDHNLRLRSTYDGRMEPLTTDGAKDFTWDAYGAKWSPDSIKLAVTKVDTSTMSPIPVIHWLKPAEEVEWALYPRISGFPQAELFILDILSRKRLRIETSKQEDHYIRIWGWLPDGSELLFYKMSRDMKKVELMAANPGTGSTRAVLTESQKTFVAGSPLNSEWNEMLTFLAGGKMFLWLSERDGWNHIYLYAGEGTLIRRLTAGEFPVERIVAVDEKAGWVYFTARAEQRRYDTHLYRVSLEGKGFARLTEGNGAHTVQFAPSKEFFLDKHSSADRPPAVELRSADGKPRQTLSRADIEALKELKWRPPEEFIVKAADGKTDLYGVIYQPWDFDPNRKYPVIEYIYNGPQGSVLPRAFADEWQQLRALAQLGFIVFIVEGRGTVGRGKAFQDVVYGNIGRHEIPDHVTALKQLAARRPYMDLSRVGIYGLSWGGYMTLRAMLLAPDVYHVGIATCPVADLHSLAIMPLEPYMGLAQKRAYAQDARLPQGGPGRDLYGNFLLTGFEVEIAPGDQPASAPPLVWLATEFVRQKWSMKAMLRRSRTNSESTSP